MGVAQQGYTHQFLMHAILAISALHLAYLKPESRVLYSVVSTKHQSRAINLFNTTCTHITEDNCHAAFVLSSLVPLCACAWPAINPSDSPIDDIVKLFTLVRGVHDILRYSWDWVNQGPFADIIPKEMPSVALPAGLQKRLDSLEPLLHGCDPDGSATLAGALSELKYVYSVVLAQTAGREIGMVLMWSIKMPYEFILLIQQRNLPALVVSAYYCVLLHSHEDYWFVRGWGSRVLGAIVDSMPLTWREWIQWPTEYVGSDSNIGDRSFS